MFKEKFDEYATEHELTAQQYFAFLRLAKGDPTMSSLEAFLQSTEQDYKAVLQALREVE